MFPNSASLPVRLFHADVWEWKLEACGCDSPEGGPDPVAGLFPLLGRPDQH